MEVKIGDRYRHKTDSDVWEVVDSKTAVCIEVGSWLDQSDLNSKLNPDVLTHNTSFEYLGNYAKSNNFKVVYDILNDGN